jgi:hypothetical protein
MIVPIAGRFDETATRGLPLSGNHATLHREACR